LFRVVSTSPRLLTLISTPTLTPHKHTGNTYFIENIGDRNAKLFFTQARKVALEEEEEMALGLEMEGGTGGGGAALALRRSSEPRKIGSGGQRSSSTGVPGSGEKVRRAMSTKV